MESASLSPGLPLQTKVSQDFDLNAADVDWSSISVPAPVLPKKPTANKQPVNQVVGKPASSTAKLEDEIQKQLAQSIKLHRPSFTYRLGLVFASLVMLAMPLAYTVLVAATAWLVYYYTFHVFPGAISGIGLRGGRAMIFVMIALVAPIVAGVTVVIFMFKPIFFSLVDFRPNRTRSLTREGEPLLFELVDRICDPIKAPRPHKIQVNSEVNASASYGVGLKAIFRRELVLTIGVPLVSGLSTRQFAGILAHEFGHFSQGAGMRAQMIIGSINLWFAKVVYARDGLDEMLDEAIEDSESAFGLVLMLAKVCVVCVRGILWCFMFAAHMVSSVFSRQMEFDADRYEIALVGSDVFKETGRDLQLLGASYGKALNNLVVLLNKAVLIDNLPRLVILSRQQMSSVEVAKVDKSLAEEKTGLFDSHPCTRQRSEVAERLAVGGVFTIDRPAPELFRHYDSLCKNVTQDFYRNVIGRMVDPNELKPTDNYAYLVAQGKV